MVGAMSFQRTLTRFSARAMTPSGTSEQGFFVQFRTYTLEFSPSSIGPSFESFGRWSMNAAVAARPSREPNTSRPATTKQGDAPPRPARIAALALAPALARVARQGAARVDAPHGGAGRQARSDSSDARTTSV